MSGIGTAIKGLLNGGKIVEQVGNVIDNLSTSKEEKEQLKIELTKELNRHAETVESEITERMKAELADTDSARQTNVRIQESEKASWLSKNIAYLIDCFIILVWGILTFYILARFLNLIAADTKVDFTGVLGIWGGVTAMATTVINFHRGSSIGSEKKQKSIDKMIQR